MMEQPKEELDKEAPKESLDPQAKPKSASEQPALKFEDDGDTVKSLQVWSSFSILCSIILDDRYNSGSAGIRLS